MKSIIIKQTLLSALALLLTFTGFAQSKLGSGNLESPFEGIDVPFQQWQFNAQTCGKFVYTRSGTSICIPSDVLETEAGEPVVGDVTVAYREFHSPMSILVSGINMTYDENGKPKQLKTGGMYELRVFQNGNPLKLAEGMQANVKMRSFSTDNNYDFFQYDDDGNSWTKLPEKGTRIQNEIAQAETEEPYWGDAFDSEGFDETEFNGDNDFGDDWWGEWEGEVDTSWHQIDEFVNSIFYSGPISEFGIYNYDVIMNQTPIAKIKSQFFIPNVKDRERLRIYVVYKNDNTVFSFDSADFEDKFYLYTDRPAKIFAVLPGNRVSLFAPESLAQLDLKKLHNKSHIWEMDSPSAAFDNQSEVQNYLNFN